ASFLVFFFQAEDGIRDRNVTGVQTCALPIFPKMSDAIIVKKSVNSNCIFTEDDNDAAKLTKLFPIFNPSPVLVTTPTIIPAQAVAAATPNAVRAPDVNAFII